MSEILDAAGHPVEDDNKTRREEIAAVDPGWWRDMNPKSLKVIDGHFWTLTHVGLDDIRLTYHGPTKRRQ